MRGVTAAFNGLVEPTVCVISRGLDVEGLLPPGVRIVRLTPGETDFEPAPILLVVLDVRGASLNLLAQTRQSRALGAVPALLVADDDDDPALAELGADDVVGPPFGRSTINRVRTLIELGRARFTLWFAQQALEHSVSGLTLADRLLSDTPIVHATPIFERITGYPLSEVRGRNGRFLQGPDTDRDARATLGDAVREQRRAQVTLLNYKKDGTPFWNQVTVFPVQTQDGRPLRWIGGVQHDVTSFVKARAEVNRLLKVVHERQQFDQAILDGVDVGIVTTDTGGRVTFVNRFARDVLCRGGSLEGEDVRTLLSLPSTPVSTFARQSGGRWLHALLAGERDIEIDLTVSRAEQVAHEHLGFFFIFHDRTQEKQLELERRRFDHLAALGTMVAGFAHEIRNPMASLRSLAESLEEELAEAHIELPHVGRMLKVLERVERLVRSSLVFGRPSPPRPAPHRPWAILSAAVASMQPRTQELGGELRVEVDPELPDVFVDDGQMSQVLVILLNNALDATGSPEHVLLRARQARSGAEKGRKARSDPPSAPYVRFEVCDDGPGIPPENRERIFDPFFTTTASGTGLGLAIAQQLATENAARIELASPLGGPTTFSVLVPVAGADPPSLSRP